jgi:flagellar motor switch protein FliN/FliY
MSDQSISQAEIDALVRGLTGSSAPAPAASAPAADGESGLLQGPLGEFVTTGLRALSELVGTGCTGTLADVQNSTIGGAEAMAPNQVVFGSCALTSGLTGSMFYIVPTPMALAMITQIYGGVAPSALDDSALGALSDGLTQFNQTGLGAIGQVLGTSVFGGPVEVAPSGTLAEASGLASISPVTVARFQVSMGDDAGDLFLVLPQPLVASIAEAVKRVQSRPAAPAPKAHAPAAPAPQRQVAAAAAPAAQAPAAAPYQPAKFPDLTPRPSREETRNIDLLMDVSLQVTVELGRTRRQIRDVLSLGPGSVLELDKLAGEQVDVLVNGKLIAKGEVVVIDENYGVRITDIISPVERVQSLK